MRTILNASLPPQTMREVDAAIKKGGFAGKSEFVRHLFRIWKEYEFLQELDARDRDFKAGKGILLKSWGQLDK